MLCCLLFSLLLAQCAGLVRQVRQRIFALVANRAGGAFLWRHRTAALFSVQALTLATLVLGHDHLVHEMRGLLTATGALSPGLQALCTLAVRTP